MTPAMILAAAQIAQQLYAQYEAFTNAAQAGTLTQADLDAAGAKLDLDYAALLADANAQALAGVSAGIAAPAAKLS